MVDPSADPAHDTVSVGDHERLLQDLAALREQFEAADEVLSAMGRSATDPDTVLSTIVASARRLCRSDAAHLYLLHEGVYQLNQTIGISEDAISFIAEHPLPLDRHTLVGRVGLDRRTQQIPDVLADPEYGRHDLQQIAGFR